jgi:DNA-binding NtrC family response regulator
MHKPATVQQESIHTAPGWTKDLLAHSIVARSATMRTIYERIDMIAQTSATVLITGETGVGKELIAEYIHRTSPRGQHPYIKVGLAALPPELLESELFGHEKGAFTNAFTSRRGLFELADTGTLLLDDIDDFPLHLQVKLLRVLEAHEVMRVGGTRSIPIDVRMLCATKVDLQSLVKRGLFRSDLFYRINVMPVTIPPLRERPEDISLLIEHFLRRYSREDDLRLSAEALARLTSYSWPGNIRELRNVAQRIALTCHATVEVADLPLEVRDQTPVHSALRNCARCFAEGDMSLDELLRCLEYNMLLRALRETRGNRTHAADMLRMSLSTFRDRLKKHRLDHISRKTPIP